MDKALGVYKGLPLGKEIFTHARALTDAIVRSGAFPPGTRHRISFDIWDGAGPGEIDVELVAG
jgi:hypothetical protein